MVEGIADALVRFIDRYSLFFRTRAHDNAAVAQRYLHGLAQADEASFAAMAAVVEDSCEQQFQHFISNSPWRHEPVVEQIARDADRLLGGRPTSALIIDESSFVKQGIARLALPGSGAGAWVRSITVRWRCLPC